VVLVRPRGRGGEFGAVPGWRVWGWRAEVPRGRPDHSQRQQHRTPPLRQSTQGQGHARTHGAATCLSRKFSDTTQAWMYPKFP